MIEIGTVLQDRYLIEEKIGAGGMGAVYRAIDQRFGSAVAIKETFYKDEELGDAFEREARLLNSLFHPVLPHVSDYFSENNGHFLVMQFIEGEDLFVTLKRDGAFPVQDVVRWTDSLLDALDYLHSQDPPIIHRDIKPQNLKVTPRSDVILLDFGLAKLNSQDTLGALSVFGYSKTYSPLEQIQGTGTDVRSDIFALGATAYHLLTGKPPIDVLARASAIVAGNADPLQLASDINENVPVAIAVILKSALALNPAQRFVSANAMRLALQHAVNSDLTENVEELTSPMSVAAPLENQVVSPADAADFPALEAFADDVKSLKREETDDVNPIIVDVRPDIETALPAQEISIPPAYVSYAPTKVNARQNQSRIPFAALAAVLLLVGLAAGYFIIKANSSDETNQPAVVDSAKKPDSNLVQTVADSVDDKSGKPEVPVVEISEKTKNVPVKKKTTVEVQETTEDSSEQQPVITENPQPKLEIKEVSLPVPTRQAPRPVPQKQKEKTSGSDEPQSVPDIESIFTGRASNERDKKEGRNRDVSQDDRDVISEEEFKEMQRQRKQERRNNRRDKKPFPFY
ncbi:MAG TPA: serine/threonine-protein kinase [Pyrinomonadaceae bacterium]|jgi:serine/threonine protein kinase